MVAEHRYGEGAQRLARQVIRLMVWALVPFIVFFVTARLHFSGGVGLGLVLGFVVGAVVWWLAYQVGTRLLRLDHPSAGAMICVSILPNTGYLGVPLTAALLGHGALPPAIAWDTIIGQTTLYTAGFATGAAFGTTA